MNKMKNNITNTLCSSVVLLFYCRFERLAINVIIGINKQQTANEKRQQFFWFIFYKKRMQTTSLLPKTSNTSFCNNASLSKFLEQRCDILSLILYKQLAIEVSSQRASACEPRSEKSFPAKLSNEYIF